MRFKLTFMVSQVISRYKFTLVPFSNSDLKIMYSVVYSMYLTGMLFLWFLLISKIDFFFQIFNWGWINYDKMTIFHYRTFFVTAFLIFWTYWVLKSKKSKMPLQKKFNKEKWSFYHNLSSSNQKIEKNRILENFGPLRSNFWT